MSAQELVGFLSSPKSEVVQIALENLLPFTSTQQQVFLDNEYAGVKALKQLSLKTQDPNILQNSLIALVNLTSDEGVRKLLASDNATVSTYVKYAAATPKLSLSKYAIMILNNISREPEAISHLSGPLLTILILTVARPQNKSDEDYDFLVMAFNEIARQNPDSIAKMLPNLFVELVDGTANRRKGVAATIKNCLFKTDLHEPFCNDTPLIETIMISLKGPEELDDEDLSKLPPTVKEVYGPNKKREEDPIVQHLLLECLLLICSTGVGRSALREKNAYFVVRELHKASKDPQVVAACEEYVNMVLRGEPEADPNAPAIEGAENADDDVTEIV